MFVSDFLHYDALYRILSTCNIGIQNLLFVLYFLKFREAKPSTCYTGVFFVLLSFSGWCLLVSHYEKPLHLIGFSMYTNGLGVYWIIIFVLDKIEFITERQNYIFYISASIFITLYSILYLLNNSQAFVYEHIGMILFSCANLYFFATHDPNPLVLITVESQYSPVEQV